MRLTQLYSALDQVRALESPLRGAHGHVRGPESRWTGTEIAGQISTSCLDSRGACRQVMHVALASHDGAIGIRPHSTSESS